MSTTKNYIRKTCGCSSHLFSSLIRHQIQAYAIYISFLPCLMLSLFLLLFFSQPFCRSMHQNPHSSQLFFVFGFSFFLLPSFSSGIFYSIRQTKIETSDSRLFIALMFEREEWKKNKPHIRHRQTRKESQSNAKKR